MEGDEAPLRNAPCYGCVGRTVGCHANCKLYLAYKADRERWAKARYAETDAKIATFDGINRVRKSFARGEIKLIRGGQKR